MRKFKKTIQIFAWQDTGLKSTVSFKKMKMEKVVVYTIKVYIMKNYWILYGEKMGCISQLQSCIGKV